jgi:hypothetical protein
MCDYNKGFIGRTNKTFVLPNFYVAVGAGGCNLLTSSLNHPRFTMFLFAW